MSYYLWRKPNSRLKEFILSTNKFHQLVSYFMDIFPLGFFVHSSFDFVIFIIVIKYFVDF